MVAFADDTTGKVYKALPLNVITADVSDDGTRIILINNITDEVVSQGTSYLLPSSYKDAAGVKYATAADGTTAAANETMLALSNILGSLEGGGGVSAGRQVDVLTISDLPAPSGGVIDCGNDGKLYFFYDMVDLGGLTFRTGNNVFRGISQELAGVENGTVEVLATCTVSDFRFNSVNMIFNAPTGAYDWNRCNFYNCPNAIDIQAADNIVWETFGFINSENVQISGIINSFVMSPNCIFRSVTNPTAKFFTIKSTAVINRRIRIEESVFQTSAAGQQSVTFEAGATIGNERLRFINLLFQGPGTALTGINGDDIRALFKSCSGGNVRNSARTGHMYMSGNASATTIASAGVAYKVVGIFTPSASNQRFTFDAVNNLLTCTSPDAYTYKLIATMSVISGSNKKIGGYICLNLAGNPIDPMVDKLNTSENYVPSSTGSRPDVITMFDSVSIKNGDRLYLAVENESDTTAVTVEVANLLIDTASI